ncbi:phage tail protein [Escherichia coli]
MPLTVAAEGGCMAIKGLEYCQKPAVFTKRRRAAATAINRVARPRYLSWRHRLPVQTKVRRKLVKERARSKGPRSKSQARIKVNRGIRP